MTNKPMLSVEREVIEKALRDALTIRFDTDSHVKKLRALLDKEVNFLTPDCPDCACVQDGQCLCIPSKPAAQHQGEPVSCVIAFREGVKEPELLSWNQMPVGEHRLYAEQLAPVAVLMPEHTMRSVMDAIQKARGFPVLTSNQCHALAESLNYVARLNGVKP